MSLETQENVRTAQIVSCVNEILQTKESITPETDLFLLGLDSVTAVNLIVSLESQFGITFNDDELIVENFSTVRKITEHVTDKLEGTL
ncbi:MULTISPECIES: acyl carrier protein [Paenibacillus]|uniref:acyl carrier protein n=1 Tax=Paenibacillus TaxID=44249 RepID=UPI00020D7497|nr:MULTISPECIES: acyl carrier protein [Paenibacillus]EGL15173.1 phosphopantetheine attachment domain protein [Paenibacillus sp. HGF7]EPD93601.1 acyl carrier protein [Paenibacillus sp. HGH0039]MBV6716491.1 acyl carrier protein [Paenibacillus chitinolyticus]